MRNAGFTRTEAVVGVIIVLMLAAIVYPKMRSAREYAGWMNPAAPPPRAIPRRVPCP